VQLEKALYGLPEAGKLWHELLRDNLTACKYKHRPIDTTTWKRIERKDGKTAAVSVILVLWMISCIYRRPTLEATGSETSSMQT
jgi:hypothetical protein